MHYNQLRVVMTGASCNMNCSYCIAGYSGNRPQGGRFELNEARLGDLISQHTFTKISIWGGEPFYNFDKLQKTVEFCRQFFPSLPILIISNGTALSKEKVDFINSNNISLTLSHDAGKQFFRGADYLKSHSYFDLIKQINNIGFTSVIHRYNCDIPDIFNYFEKIRLLLQRELYWGFELFQLSTPSSMKYLPNIPDFEKSIEFLLEQFAGGHPFAYSSMYNILNGMAQAIDTGNPPLCRCGALNRLTVNTDGQVAFCQVQAENGRFDRPDLMLPQMCRSCGVASFCAGICPNTSDTYREIMCPVYKVFYQKLQNFLINLANLSS